MGPHLAFKFWTDCCISVVSKGGVIPGGVSLLNHANICSNVPRLP